MLNLITDRPNTFESKLITESKNGSNGIPTYTLKGIYAVSEMRNGNNRVYRYDDLKREIDRFDNEMIRTGRALGALEHPNYPEIKPEDAAIRILKMSEDDKSWIGESCILASCPEKGIKGTAKGDLLLGIVQYGTKMGFSSRSLGTVDESTGIVDDLHLLTFDVVCCPSSGQYCDSNADRFVNGILESKQFIINEHGEILESKFNSFEKKISKMPNTNIRSKKYDFLASAATDFLKTF